MINNQSGSALAISLVLLTAITIISMMGLQRSGLQTKIVANATHKENTYHTAKTIVHDSYDFLNSPTPDVQITQVLSDALDIATQHKFENTKAEADRNIADLPPLPIPLNISSNLLGKNYATERATPFNNVQINVNVFNPFIDAQVSLRPVLNDNALQNPNASMLRSNFSRGKDGSGIKKFDLLSGAFLPTISSRQVVGVDFMMPTL